MQKPSSDVCLHCGQWAALTQLWQVCAQICNGHLFCTAMFHSNSSCCWVDDNHGKILAFSEDRNLGRESPKWQQIYFGRTISEVTSVLSAQVSTWSTLPPLKWSWLRASGLSHEKLNVANELLVWMRLFKVCHCLSTRTQRAKNLSELMQATFKNSYCTPVWQNIPKDTAHLVYMCCQNFLLNLSSLFWKRRS